MDRTRIDTLVEDLTPFAPPRLGAFVARIALGFVIAVLFVVAVIRLRPDLAAAAGTFGFWFKQSVVALPLLIGAIATWRLARPTARLTKPVQALLIACAVFTILGLIGLEAGAQPPGGELRTAGADGLHCLLFAGLASLPMVFIGLRWMRTMAPTQLSSAALALGLLAGGVGASAYALHCPYESAGYIALWYGLAIALVSIAARLFLPRRLEW